MPTTYNSLKKKLEDFYKSDESIKACMLIEEHIEGIIIIPETFKNNVTYIWDDIEHVLKNQVEILKKYGVDGLVQMNFSIAEFGILMYLIESDIVLAVVTDKTELNPELIEIDHRTKKELIPTLNKDIGRI